MKIITHQCLKSLPLLKKSSKLPLNQGFKRLFQCKCMVQNPSTNQTEICNSRFSTQEMLDKHQIRHLGALKQETIIVNGKYIEGRIDECGKKVLVFSHHECQNESCNCKEKKTISSKCFNRNCPKCEKPRRARYIKSFKRRISTFRNRICFMTLTFQGHHEFSTSHKKSIEKDIKKFIDMLKYINPGYKIEYVRVLEVKDKSDGYYYHFHYVIDMPYIDKFKLMKMWHKATDGKSCVINIQNIAHTRQTRNGKQVVYTRGSSSDSAIIYISKYLAKPLDNISSDQYASVVYRNKFVESTNLDNRAMVEEKSDFLMCKKCGNMLKYQETLDLRGENQVKDIQIRLGEP